MNIGPTELGTIDQIDLDIMAEIGEWLKINGESIYGRQTRSPLYVQTFGETTLKNNNDKETVIRFLIQSEFALKEQPQSQFWKDAVAFIKAKLSKMRKPEEV